MTKFVKFFKDDSGASAAEYALILAIVGAGIALGVTQLGTAINDSITNATDEVKTANGL